MRWIVIPLLCAFLSTSGFSQTKAAGEQPSFEGQHVGSIELVANPHLDTQQFRSLIVQKAGEPFSGQMVQASVDALKQTGAFSKVDVQVKPDPSGLKLIFVLQPAYYIAMLDFPGALKAFNYTRLLQVADIPDQTAYQPDHIPAVESALLRFFQDNGFFHAKVHTEVRSDDQNQLVNLVFNVQLGKRARIGRVVIAGATPEENRHLEGTIRSLRARFTGALLKPGKPYGQKRIKAATALLRTELGKQHHPASKILVNPPNYHPETNRADLAIYVDAGPKVEIRVVGAKLSWLPFQSGRQRKKLIPIYEEASTDPDLVQEGERNLFNYFQRKGYFNAKVTTNIQQQNGNMILTYQITKGRKHSVRDISFAGNHSLESDDLLNKLAIKKKHFISHGLFSEKLLRTSVTNIENFYKDNGFEQVKVTPEVVDREPNLYVTFNIAEGDRTIVSSLRVEGNKSIPLQELRSNKSFALEEGKPFSPQRLSSDRNHIAAKYLDLGFLNSEVKTVVSRHPDNPREVDVTYAITENQQVRVSRVLYMGQKRTRVSLLKQSTNLWPEKPLSQGKLLQAESNLYDLNVFDWSSISPRKPITSQPEEETLVKVHEAKRTTITYGFGLEISRRGGNVPTGTIAVPGLPTINLQGSRVLPGENTFVSPRGSIEFLRRNMRGLAETAGVSLLVARLDQRLLFTYTVPHFRDSSWEALASISGERNTENPLFEARLQDASLQFQRYLDQKKTLQLQLRYDYNHTRLTQLLVPQLVLPADRDVKLSFVSGTLIRDTRDKPLDAHKGLYQTMDLRIVPSAFGSSADFVRMLSQYAFYKPVHGMVFANSIRLGLAAPFANSDVPTSQRFFSGGGTTLRGFPINEAGPIRFIPFCPGSGSTANCPLIPIPVGGNQLFIFNSELRYPIPIMNNLGGVVFYDGGNVYRRINFRDFVDHYTNTVGVGLRYNTPIGPVRFDIGRNLNPVPGISKTQFFITLGQAF
jgi:outer membrane protein assembly factor BamA